MISDERLRNHHLTRPFRGPAAELVAWMGAVQAQEYEYARWGLGQRLAGKPTAAAIEEEIAAGRILRTHVLRPTWHFVAAEDLRWMLALSGPRVHARMAPYNRQLELDAKTLTRATGLIERALGEGGCVTRAELAVVLRRARIAIDPIRLAHIVMHAELEAVICSGPRRERQFTYALVSERAPAKGREPQGDRDAALGELARRFFQSHGPATIRDFVWWSGLTTPDAKRGAEIARASSMRVRELAYWTAESASAARPRAGSRSRPGVGQRPTVHLLPIYDEYLVAYRDREAVPHGSSTMFKDGRAVGYQHAILIDGQVVGTWKTPSRTGPQVDLLPARRLTRSERDALEAEARRYARFVG